MKHIHSTSKIKSLGFICWNINRRNLLLCYSPSTVILKKGIPAQVNFDMHDSTACLSHVVFEQLGVNKDLTIVDFPADSVCFPKNHQIINAIKSRAIIITAILNISTFF